jgi:hypothetical protein
MPNTTVKRFVVPVLVVVCLLGGCSGAKDDKPGGSPQVASLQSPSTPSESQETADDQRPLIALDATDEEREAAWDVWGDCVKKEGGPGYENPKTVFIKEHQQDAKAKKIRAACLPQEPETVEDRLKRKDISAFRDNQREWYKCAGEAGYQLTTPDENGEFGITEVGPNGDFGSPKMEACRKEAFSR